MDAVDVGESEDRIEMHCRPQPRHCGDNDSLGRLLLEQRCRKLADRLPGRALAHADRDVTLADRHHIASFQSSEAVIFGWIAPPDVDLTRKVRVELVDRCREDGLFMPRRPE